jgi:hypothetical protein
VVVVVVVVLHRVTGRFILHDKKASLVLLM